MPSTKSSTTTAKSARTGKAVRAPNISANVKRGPAAKKQDDLATKTSKTADLVARSRKRKASESLDNEADALPAKTAKNTPKKNIQNMPPLKKKAAANPKKINHPLTQILDIYVFGEGSAGELGLGAGRLKDVMEVKRPRLNQRLGAKLVGVVQVAVGGMHCAALTHDNKILTWGVNDQGALGRKTDDGPIVDLDAVKDIEEDEEDMLLEPGVSPHGKTVLMLVMKGSDWIEECDFTVVHRAGVA